MLGQGPVCYSSRLEDFKIILMVPKNCQIALIQPFSSGTRTIISLWRDSSMPYNSKSLCLICYWILLQWCGRHFPWPILKWGMMLRFMRFEIRFIALNNEKCRPLFSSYMDCGRNLIIIDTSKQTVLEVQLNFRNCLRRNASMTFLLAWMLNMTLVGFKYLVKILSLLLNKLTTIFSIKKAEEVLYSTTHH